MNGAVYERECEVFTRHIIGRAPTAYVVRRYADAHAVMTDMEPRDAHERWLLRVARRHPALCRVADAWACLAAPRSVLRRKLVVLLAILEVSPPFAAALDQPVGGPGREWTRIVMSGLTSMLAFAVGVVLFLPVRVAASGPER